ncbi:MAG: hypothetical protein RLY61_474 [Candidatus Parcubacteria bacterium]
MDLYIVRLVFISIVIPAYKQEKTIVQDMERVWNVLSGTRFDFELIVVVDGMLDNTFEVAKSFKKDNVKVLGYKENMGKGFAVKYGMRRAQGDYIAFIDAGMEIDPNGISMIMEHMLWYNADIIVGSKRHPASRVVYPRIRRVYSWGYYLLVRLLFQLKLTDTQTGLKLYKREVLEKALPRLVIKQYAFDIELLAVAKYLGYTRIFEAPVTVSLDFGSGTRLRSRLFLLDNFVRGMLYDTLAVFYRMYFLRYYRDDNKENWLPEESNASQ